MASASLARGLSSEVNPSVSSGSMSFRRKLSLVTRKGLASLRAVLIILFISLLFTGHLIPSKLHSSLRLFIPCLRGEGINAPALHLLILWMLACHPEYFLYICGLTTVIFFQFGT